VALHYQSRQKDVGEAISHDMHKKMVELEKHVQAIERRAAGVKADTAAAASDTTADGSDDSSSAGVDDPVAAVEDILRDHGLDPDDFEVHIDDQFGSLQAANDGYLEDDDFSAWQDVADEAQLTWDNDNGRYYLKSEDFPEVLG